MIERNRRARNEHSKQAAAAVRPIPLRSVAMRSVVLGALLATSVGVGGCLNYGNYPRAEKDLTWYNSRVTAGVLELMEQSLAYVIEEDLASQPQFAAPPSGEPLAAINLPGGVSPEQYRRVAGNVHPGVVPLSEARSDLPVYQISAIDLRGREAEVRLLRPVKGLQRGVDEPLYAGLQVWFQGGSGGWRPIRERAREVGTLDAPKWVPIEVIERAIAQKNGETVEESLLEGTVLGPADGDPVDDAMDQTFDGSPVLGTPVDRSASVEGR